MPNTPDIDVSALAEALNEKMDRDMDNRTVNVHYIVETWHSGTEWYRVWSDGWIEQGGVDSNTNLIATINLNKSFTDANYTVVITCAQNVTSSSAYDIGAYNKTTTTFARIGINSNGSANNTTNWYACGF